MCAEVQHIDWASGRQAEEETGEGLYWVWLSRTTVRRGGAGILDGEVEAIVRISVFSYPLKLTWCEKAFQALQQIFDRCSCCHSGCTNMSNRERYAVHFNWVVFASRTGVKITYFIAFPEHPNCVQSSNRKFSSLLIAKFRCAVHSLFANFPVVSVVSLQSQEFRKNVLPEAI